VRQAVTVAPRLLEIHDVPEPVATAGQAIIEVDAVGLCAGDLMFYTGEHPYVTYPNTQGHEFSGRILSFGEGYNGALSVGERVSVEPLIPCFTCLPCRRGRPNCCTRLQVIGAHVPGGLAERVALPTRTLYSAAGLDAELGALVEPISIGLHGVRRSRLERDDRMVVFGAGPIGQAVILAARDIGARVVAVDRLPTRLELATRFGAELTVDASFEDPAQVIAEWTSGDGPVVAIEATGVPDVVRQAIDVVASSGTVVVIGLSSSEVHLPMIEFTRKEISVVGSRNSTGIFGEAVDLVRRKADAVRDLVTHRFPFERAGEAIEFTLANRAHAEKVMVHMRPLA